MSAFMFGDPNDFNLPPLTEHQKRIMGIVARSQGRQFCKRCGFKRFTGGVHPHGGVYAADRRFQKWCDGTRSFYSRKDVEKKMNEEKDDGQQVLDTQVKGE